MMDQISSAVNNPGQQGLSLSLKMCTQFGRNDFSLSFVFDCEVLRKPSCKYLRISKISNDVTLIEKMSASYWVVTQWSSLTMASALCSISRLTAVTEWPEGHKSGAPLFLFQKPSLCPPCDQWCFCWPQHFHRHCKEDVCGCFSLTVYRQKEILSQHIVCTAHHWLAPLCGIVAMVLSATNLYNL